MTPVKSVLNQIQETEKKYSNMPKNVIEIHPQIEGQYDQILESYNGKVEKLQFYKSFLIELREVIYHEEVRRKIDKFLESNK